MKNQVTYPFLYLNLIVEFFIENFNNFYSQKRYFQTPKKNCKILYEF